MTLNRILTVLGFVAITVLCMNVPMPWWGGCVVGFVGGAALRTIFPWNE